MSYLVNLVVEPLIYGIVIFVAVRAAISPMLNNGKRFGLFDDEHVKKMKVIGILNDDLIRKYHELNVKEHQLDRELVDYKHFKVVLERLLDAEMITEMQFEKKMIELKKYYSLE